MGEYGKEDKKIIFSESGKRHAEFKIKLQYDDLGQSEFFRSVVAAYLDEDPLFMSFVDSMKGRIDKQKQRQREIVKKERNKAKENERVFSLTEDEVENIFDILERETGI